MTDAGIVLTDPVPVVRPKDGSCPTCRAEKEQRVLSGGFGRPHEVCGRCGFEFVEEAHAVSRQG